MCYSNVTWQCVGVMHSRETEAEDINADNLGISDVHNSFPKTKLYDIANTYTTHIVEML